MGESQYSFSLTTFSPSGKLVQIEHALAAVSGGATSLGIKARKQLRLRKLKSNLYFSCRVAPPDSKSTLFSPQAKNGVVIATEKKLPSVLVDEATVQKVKLTNPLTADQALSQ